MRISDWSSDVCSSDLVYFPAAEMLRLLGIGRVRMMTNNPQKLDQFAACGVEVVERVRHVFPSNRHNERYLDAKAKRSGHLFCGSPILARGLLRPGRRRSEAMTTTLIDSTSQTGKPQGEE